jgi:GT2 family glycosyltransferase
MMALKHKADYMLFLDSDMRFPKNIANRLITHDKDIVACNYSTRRLPAKPVAWTNFSMQEFITSHDRAGVEEVDAIAMGAMLVKAEVFTKLPNPWFQVVYSKSARAFIGEDIYFCQLAKAHGFKVHVDHDLSREIKHIGSFEFGHEHVAVCREQEDAE